MTAKNTSSTAHRYVLPSVRRGQRQAAGTVSPVLILSQVRSDTLFSLYATFLLCRKSTPAVAQGGTDFGDPNEGLGTVNSCPVWNSMSLFAHVTRLLLERSAVRSKSTDTHRTCRVCEATWVVWRPLAVLSLFLTI